MLTTLWFWVVIVELVLIAYAVHEDEFYPPILGCIGGLAALHFFSDIQVLIYLKTNYLMIIKYFVYYVGIGAGWSVIKWYLFLLKEKDRYEVVREKFLKNNIIKIKNTTIASHLTSDDVKLAKEGIIPQDWKEDWKSEMMWRNLPPTAKENKSRLMTWCSYWLVSMIGTFLGDFLQQAFDVIYNLLGNLYDRITKAVFGKFDEDFK